MLSKSQSIIATGVGIDLHQLGEVGQTPSGELVYLAYRWLGVTRAAHLYTSLALGWEQALAEAAIERSISYHVVVPSEPYQIGWTPETFKNYHKLTQKAQGTEHFVPQTPPCHPDLPEHLRWMIDQSQVVLVLWNYSFTGPVFQALDYALKKQLKVINLWEEWRPLRAMRKKSVAG